MSKTELEQTAKEFKILLNDTTDFEKAYQGKHKDSMITYMNKMKILLDDIDVLDKHLQNPDNKILFSSILKILILLKQMRKRAVNN